MAMLDADNDLGPVYHSGAGREVDFTLLFEEIVFFIVPLSVVAIYGVFRIIHLVKLPTTSRVDYHLLWKTAIFVLIGATECSQRIALHVQDGLLTRGSLAALVVALLAHILLAGLSVCEHLRSRRPSSSLLLFLLGTLIPDAIRIRTMFRLGASTDRLVTAFAYVGLKGIAIMLELKQKVLRNENTAVSAEERSSIINRAFLWWVSPLFVKGFRSQLEADELPPIDENLSLDLLDEYSNDQGNMKKYKGPDVEPSTGLLSRIFQTHWQLLVQPALPRTCHLALTLSQSFLLRAAASYISLPREAKGGARGGALILGYALVYAGLAVTWSLYMQKSSRAAVTIRAGLVGQIIKRTSTMPLGAATSSATTLVIAHVDNVQMGFRRINDLWANVLGAGIALWLLYREIGLPMLAVMGLSFASVFVSFGLSKLAAPHQQRWLDQVDNRVQMTALAISSLRSIIFSGSALSVRTTLLDARQEDITLSQRFRSLLIAIITISFMSMIFSPALGIGIYSHITLAEDGKTVDPATAFASLTILTLIGSFIAQAIEGAMAFITMLGCVSRIDAFLRQDLSAVKLHDGRKNSENPDSRPSTQEKVSGSNTQSLPNSLQDYNAKWQADSTWVVSKISITITPGQSIMILGPAGCGKSTLLQAIMGQVPFSKGTRVVQDVAFGYCAQPAWLFEGTIRENIVGLKNLAFDRVRYQQTLELCELDRDLQTLPMGDATSCRGDGLNLSGGQRARIGLARAIFSHASVLVLDDCWSHLDNTTRTRILDRLLGPQIFDHWKPTIIMAASNPTHLGLVDRILILRPDGTISYDGGYAGLPMQQGNISDNSAQTTTRAETNVRIEEPQTLPHHEQDEHLVLKGMSTKDQGLPLLRYYTEILGKRNSFLFSLLCAIFGVALVYPQAYLKDWTQRPASMQQQSLSTLLGVYFGLGSAALLTLGFSCAFFTLQMASRASSGLHRVTLDTVLNAPESFHAKMTGGSIINRFSQDLHVIDRELPYALIGASNAITQGIGHCVLIVLGSRFASVALPVVLGVAGATQTIYLCTSRQLRILDLEAKAPLVSYFNDFTRGLSTMRALGWVDSMAQRGLEALASSQKPFYILSSAQILLELTLDLTNAGLAVIIVSIGVALKSSPDSAAGLGLALTSVVSLGQIFKNLIRTWTNLEVSLGAVGRVKQFSEHSGSCDEPGSAAPPLWPAAGKIQFDRVTTIRKNNSRPIVDNFSLLVPAGAKVGICGRTGSGKSTLISCLVRLVDLDAGSVLIDGVNVASIPRSDLTARIAALPQDIFYFPSTVRDSMSANGVTDEEIRHCLHRVGLWTYLETRGGLDAVVSDELLSHGQMQLLSLARVILRRQNKILILDEPASSVDAAIQRVMDEVIWSDFGGSTVLCVAHRLETLIKFDQVIVMDQGRIVEMGHPRDLLQSDSLFGRLFEGRQ